MILHTSAELSFFEVCISFSFCTVCHIELAVSVKGNLDRDNKRIVHRTNKSTSQYDAFKFGAKTEMDLKTSMNRKSSASFFDTKTTKGMTNDDTRSNYSDYFIDIEQHVPDLDELFNKTVIVTAASDNHFTELKGMIASAQREMPNTRIIVYDLGLLPWKVKKVRLHEQL